MAERAAAEAQRISSHHHSKPAPKAQGQPPTGPEKRQGQRAASLPPYQPPMSAHIEQMARYRRPRGSQPNPEANTVPAYPRGVLRSRPHSLRTSTAQDYEDSPGPSSPHDPTTHNHAHTNTSAQGHGPAHGQWWQRWPHTQL